jgi:hypothetical protein
MSAKTKGQVEQFWTDLRLFFVGASDRDKMRRDWTNE